MPAPAPGARDAEPPGPHDDQRQVSRRRATAVVAGLLVAILAAGLLLRPAPEVVTADGLAGPDGSGRTSTHAVTELTPRWDVAWNGPPSRAADVTGLHDLGDLLLLTTDREVIALRHPTTLARGRTRGLQRPVDPVLWRSPAIAGTPRPVDGRLPVVTGSELLWVSSASGELAARHTIADLRHPAAWSPAFALPAGAVLVTDDGTTVMARDGTVRWQAGEPGELVGVAGDVVVTRMGRTVRGRELATGRPVWSVAVAATGQVSARLVDGLVVTTRLGGHVAVRDPRTGDEVAAVRVGPTPVAGPEWDGEATIVGATATDVFVRVDAPVGIRYARVRVATAHLVSDLGELANDDVRGISEHAGYLVTVGRDAVVVRRGGEVAWRAVELEHPPAVDGNWLAVDVGPFGIGSVDGSRTRIRLDPSSVEVRLGRPPVLDGHAVVGTPVGLQAVELATGEPAWSRPLGTRGCCPSHVVGAGTIALSGPVRVLDADGERRWDHTAGDPGRSTRVAAIADPWVVVTHPGWTPTATRLLRVSDGRRGPDLAAGALRGVVVDGSQLFALDEAPDGTTRDVVAFALPGDGAPTGTLAPVWRRPGGDTLQLVHTGDELLAVGAAAVDHLDPGTGELLRRTPLAGLGGGPVAVAGGRLVRRLDAATLEGVHLASGDRWTRSFDRPVTAAPTVAGDVVYVAGADAMISALSLDRGDIVASVAVDGPAVHSLTVAGGVLLAGGPDRLHAFGPSPATVSRPGGRRGR